MIVSDQNDIGLLQQLRQLFGSQHGIVGTESLAEVEQILAAAVVVVGADLAFHPGERVQLRGTAARSQAGGAGHFWRPSI